MYRNMKTNREGAKNAKKDAKENVRDLSSSRSLRVLRDFAVLSLSLSFIAMSLRGEEVGAA